MRKKGFSRKRTYRKQSPTEETNERTLSGHLGKVYCLTKLSNDHLASGSIDRKIKVWNITNENLDQTLNTIPASQVLSIVLYYKI